MRKIELLAPARNAETAKEAILHGADAVYIGAPRFGARSAAGNSIDDISDVVEFAHIYDVKVYVTLNTILYDSELDDVRQMVFQLYDIGIDALIVQDMAFLEMDLPPIPLHASTQMDNRTAEKVQWLKQLGFEQVVLARELSLGEIRNIHQEVPDMPLEVFVHGATCVSYNGQCYASQYCFGRSANRGECAQFCRLPFDVIDAEGNIVRNNRTGELMRQRHVLSLHDMNRSAEVEDLLKSGVTSFKIEGRLKDSAYVKNVTSFYRTAIDDVIKRHPDEYMRSSVGVSQISFTPQLDRTFNRGFSNYFLNGRTSDMVQMFSPKSLGQYVGHVKEIRRNCFTVSGTASFSNGDGLCFIDKNAVLQGFRINRVEGNCLYPKDMPDGLMPRLPLYRNYDQAFTVQLSHPTAQRRIAVSWVLEDDQYNSNTICVTLQCEDGIKVSSSFSIELSVARTPQYENIVKQLGKLGESPFVNSRVETRFSQDWFIPSSILSEWRRQMVELLIQKRIERYHRDKTVSSSVRSSLIHPESYIQDKLDYNANVSNHLSRRFYEKLGATFIAEAMECSKAEKPGVVLMTLKYCLRYELGLCGKPMAPLLLKSADGRVFPLRFDCKHCHVQVLSPEVGHYDHHPKKS